MRTARASVVIAMLIATCLLPSAAEANHWEKYVGPDEPARDFPEDFLPLLPKDKQAHAVANPWADPHMGGWGSDECEPGHEPRTPVIFVHGNGGHADHWTWTGYEPQWVNVRQTFLDAGYCPRELWAPSYDGAGGYSTYHKINSPEVYKFIEAVRGYLGVDQIDVVTHSLGVTVVREAGQKHPDLFQHIRRFVAIAGANHGTTTCRGSQDVPGTLHVCDEIGPGSAWLEKLNKNGEVAEGPEYLAIYDGTGVADDFYLGPDALSPQMKGACNHSLPFVDHLSLGWSPQSVEIYLAFLTTGKLPTCEPYAYEPT